MKNTILLMFALVSVVGATAVAGRAAQPMLIDLAGDGIALTDAIGGVDVDIDGDGVAERVAWTGKSSDDSFLCIDHNQNGKIDVPSDLLGGATGPPNGFAFLSAMDGIASSGRPERLSDRRPDGRIDKNDAVYERLIVWTDTNHNGRSEEDELQSLAHAGILQLASGYEGVSTNDAVGNRFTYRAWARMSGARGVSVLRDVVTVSLTRR